MCFPRQLCRGPVQILQHGLGSGWAETARQKPLPSVSAKQGGLVQPCRESAEHGAVGRRGGRRRPTARPQNKEDAPQISASRWINGGSAAEAARPRPRLHPGGPGGCVPPAPGAPWRCPLGRRRAALRRPARTGCVPTGKTPAPFRSAGRAASWCIPITAHCRAAHTWQEAPREPPERQRWRPAAGGDPSLRPLQPRSGAAFVGVSTLPSGGTRVAMPGNETLP